MAVSKIFIRFTHPRMILYTWDFIVVHTMFSDFHGVWKENRESRYIKLRGVGKKRGMSSISDKLQLFRKVDDYSRIDLDKISY